MLLTKPVNSSCLNHNSVLSVVVSFVVTNKYPLSIFYQFFSFSVSHNVVRSLRNDDKKLTILKKKLSAIFD